MKETTSQLKKPIEIHDIFYEEIDESVDPELFDWVKVKDHYEYVLKEELDFYDGTRKSRAKVVVKPVKGLKSYEGYWDWSVHIRKNKQNYDISGYESSLEKAKREAVRNAEELAIYVLLDTC